MSGLTVAAALEAAGADVRVLEAAQAIGGRIQALHETSSDRVLGDLGPTWVWPKYQPVVEKWLTTLGLTTFEQFNDGDAVITGYGPAPVRQPLPGQDGMVRIAGGPSARVDAMSARPTPGSSDNNAAIA